MTISTISRKEALEGELVTIFCNGWAQIAYIVGDQLYTIDDRARATEYDHSKCSMFRYDRDGGKGWYDEIRHARKIAVTPYSKEPADISTLTKNQLIAFRIIVENGGIISRKAL